MRNFDYVVKLTTFKLADPKTLTRGRPYINTLVAVSLLDAKELVQRLTDTRPSHYTYERSAEVCVRFAAIGRVGGNVTIPLDDFDHFMNQVDQVHEEITRPDRSSEADKIRKAMPGMLDNPVDDDEFEDEPVARAG